MSDRVVRLRLRCGLGNTCSRRAIVWSVRRDDTHQSEFPQNTTCDPLIRYVQVTRTTHQHDWLERRGGMTRRTLSYSAANTLRLCATRPLAHPTIWLASVMDVVVPAAYLILPECSDDRHFHLPDTTRRTAHCDG